MDWFEKIFGFKEADILSDRENMTKYKIYLERTILHINNREYDIGTFYLKKLSYFREKVLNLKHSTFPIEGKISIRHLVTKDIQNDMIDTANKNAVFQVASQFNCLEYATEYQSKKDGITCYEDDKTQGPSIAMTVAPATFSRNYLEPDINMLEDFRASIPDYVRKIISVRNGYCNLDKERIEELRPYLTDDMKKEIRIGYLFNTTVPISSHNKVSLVYCSAVPFRHSTYDFFCKFILDAYYEATILIGIINFHKTGCRKVFLTMLGCGAFMNKESWAIDSILRALRKYSKYNLDVIMVHYKFKNERIENELKI